MRSAECIGQRSIDDGVGMAFVQQQERYWSIEQVQIMAEHSTKEEQLYGRQLHVRNPATSAGRGGYLQGPLS